MTLQIQLESLALFLYRPPPLCVRYNTEKQKANKKWGRSGYAYLPLKFNDVCYVTVHNGLAVTKVTTL